METIRQFVRDWFTCSERRMVDALKKLPNGRLSNVGHYHPQPPVLPAGLDIRVDLNVDANNRTIEVDITPNEDHYGVLLRGKVEDESLAIDVEATRQQRADLAAT